MGAAVAVGPLRVLAVYSAGARRCSALHSSDLARRQQQTAGCRASAGACRQQQTAGCCASASACRQRHTAGCRASACRERGTACANRG